MISSNVSSADGNNAGLWIELDAILAVVIGGTALTGGRFSLGGTVIGALIIQTLTTTIYSIGVPPETTLLFKALVVTVVCLLQSPAFRAKVSSRRRRPPGDRPPPAPSRRSERGGPGMTHHRAGPTAGRSSSAASRRSTSRCSRRWPAASRCSRVGSLALPGLRRPGRCSSTCSSTTRFLLVVAVGMTFVILTGGIDLSVGSVVALSTMLSRRAGPGARLAALRWRSRWCCSSAPRSASRWAAIIHYFEIQPFIVTLAGMFLARGLCYAISIDVDLDHRPARSPDRRRTRSRSRGAVALATSAVIASSWWSRSRRYVLHLHPVRPQRLRDRRQRAVRAADGPAGGPDEDRRLHDQRLLLGAGRRAARPSTCSPATACTRSGMELDAIAAVVIGGTLLTGGSGTCSARCSASWSSA